MIERINYELIDRLQAQRQELMRNIPPEGIEVEYLGMTFLVRQNVFLPFDDSMPLAQNYEIRDGETVLDVCTGSGVLAILSAKKGASRVVGLEINPHAVDCAKENVCRHGVGGIVEIRRSNMFESLRDGESFDVITGNLPFRDKKASDLVEGSQWDTELNAHRAFFKGVRSYLNPGGRIYLSQANFGAVKQMLNFASDAGFSSTLIGRRPMKRGDPRVFFAYELV